MDTIRILTELLEFVKFLLQLFFGCASNRSETFIFCHGPVSCYFNIAALMFFAPRFAFFCPLFIFVAEAALLALVQLFVIFLNYLCHISDDVRCRRRNRRRDSTPELLAHQ